MRNTATLPIGGATEESHEGHNRSSTRADAAPARPAPQGRPRDVELFVGAVCRPVCRNSVPSISAAVLHTPRLLEDPAEDYVSRNRSGRGDETLMEKVRSAIMSTARRTIPPDACGRSSERYSPSRHHQNWGLFRHGCVPHTASHRRKSKASPIWAAHESCNRCPTGQRTSNPFPEPHWRPESTTGRRRDVCCRKAAPRPSLADHRNR